MEHNELEDKNFETVELPEMSDEEIAEDFELTAQFADPTQEEDREWQSKTGLNEESLCGAIETVIFMSDRPVPLLKIQKLVYEAIPLRVLHDAITRLQDEYEQSHHGIRLQEVAEGYQFRTKATYSKYVHDLFKINSLVLSPTALEVLAIIAYKQPVSRMEIEKIRGVDSSHVVRSLMDKRLVKMSGRSDELGRPSLYATTNDFLEVFNLGTLDELPPEEELMEMVGKNEVGEISEIKEIISSTDPKKFYFDEIAELDELSKSLKAIKSDTRFTKSLSQEDKKRIKGTSEDSPKSAFELLEEFVGETEIVQVNQQSSQSELISSFTDPKVIDDMAAGPFNVPEDTDEDDTELLSLDEVEKIKEARSQVAAPQSAEEDFDQLFSDNPTEEVKKELAEALDQAFENLTGQKLPPADEMLENPELLDSIEDAIDAKTSEFLNKASEMDFDLNFQDENTSDEAKGPLQTDN